MALGEPVDKVVDTGDDKGAEQLDSMAGHSDHFSTEDVRNKEDLKREQNSVLVQDST